MLLTIQAVQAWFYGNTPTPQKNYRMITTVADHGYFQKRERQLFFFNHRYAHKLYKLSSRCCNCLNSTAPNYLTEPLRNYKPTRQLRSSADTSILFSHCTHTLAWSKVIFFCCVGSLEHSPLLNQVIQHHLILQIITLSY